MIFFRKDPVLGVDLENAINNAVFPGLQVLYNQSFCIFVDVLLALLHVIYEKKEHGFFQTSMFLQGGPHNHTIAGLAVCLEHAKSDEFKAYQEQVCLLWFDILRLDFTKKIFIVLKQPNYFIFCMRLHRWCPTVKLWLEAYLI